MSSRPSICFRKLDPEPPNLAQKSRLVNTHFLGGELAIPLVSLEYVQNELPFNIGKGLGQAGRVSVGALPKMIRKVFDFNGRTGGKDK